MSPAACVNLFVYSSSGLLYAPWCVWYKRRLYHVTRDQPDVWWGTWKITTSLFSKNSTWTFSSVTFFLPFHSCISQICLCSFCRQLFSWHYAQGPKHGFYFILIHEMKIVSAYIQIVNAIDSFRNTTVTLRQCERSLSRHDFLSSRFFQSRYQIKREELPCFQ